MKHLQTFMVDAAAIAECLKDGIQICADIPPDAQLRGCFYDQEIRMIGFTFEHPTFALCPPGYPALRVPILASKLVPLNA